MKKQLVLIKHSSVETNMSVPNQCREAGWKKYNYEFEIFVNPKNLDENGFIIDHSELHHVIDFVVKTAIDSCENLAMKIEEALLVRLKEHGVKVEKMIFSIKPEGGNAWVRLESNYRKERKLGHSKILKNYENRTHHID